MGQENLDKENHSKWKIFFDLELNNKGESTIVTGILNKRGINKFYCFSDPFFKETKEVLSDINYEQYVTSERAAPVTTSVAQDSQQTRLLQKLCQTRWNKSETDHENADSILSHSVFQTRYGINECPITCFGIVVAIKNLSKS